MIHIVFLIFELRRPDIFPSTDLGVRKGILRLQTPGRLYSPSVKISSQQLKKLKEQDYINLSEPFKPYRSILAFYLWKLEDVKIIEKD